LSAPAPAPAAESNLYRATQGLAYVSALKTGRKGYRVTYYAVMRATPESDDPAELARFPAFRNWRKALHNANECRDAQNRQPRNPNTGNPE
jgi:hypothetical protein